jgi:hypothetical protein
MVHEIDVFIVLLNMKKIIKKNVPAGNNLAVTKSYLIIFFLIFKRTIRSSISWNTFLPYKKKTSKH